MKILINNYINLIKAFTSDGVKELDSFDDLKQFCDEELDIFILDPKIHNNKINLPIARRSIHKKSIPHVLQDKSLNFQENSHFSFNNPSIDGDTFISFVDRDWIVSTFEDINRINLSINFLAPLESFGKEDCASIFEQDKYSTVNFSNKWGWTAETNLINDLLEKGIEEYGCSEVLLYTDQEDSIFLNKIKDKDQIIKLEEKFLSKISKDKKINLLSDKFKPKINWDKAFRPYKLVFISLAIVFLTLFSTKLIEINSHKVNSKEVISSANELYFNKYPNANNEDLDQFIKANKNFDSNTIESNFVGILFNLSGIINSNDKVSLSSIIYDSVKREFLIEVESLQFDDLEVFKSVIKSQGFIIQEGSSKRVGPSIFSEIIIQA